MSHLYPRVHPGVSGGIARLLVSLGLALPVCPPALTWAQKAADPNDPAAATLPAWTWVEQCHVQRGHQLTDFGTFGSLVTAAENQTILSSPHAGKNSTGASFLGTIKQDLWLGGALITYVEGGSSYTLDHIIGDSLGIDGLAGLADVYLSRQFLLQDWADRRAQLAVGRILTSDYFDTNRVANCEFLQFLSRSLVNNPTIPFPQAGLGAAARLAPASWFYVQAAAADAAAHATQSDFDTAFRTWDNTFGIFELGLSPSAGKRAGAYRFLFWHNPLGGWSGPGQPRDNDGFAMSFDQPATDRLALFFRYGSAQAPVHGLTDFASAGAVLHKPLPGRDHDSLLGAVAWGHGTPRDETLVEVDYSLHVTDSLTLTPLVQIIVDPAGNPQDDIFVVASLRAVYVF
jgi:carbohydrate-selective porin OprB